MSNLLKIQLSQETAQSIITDEFGSNKKIVFFDELKEGYFNTAYHISLDDGLQCVLKIAPPPDQPILRYEKEILKAEVDSMQLVRSKTQIPVPQIYFFRENHSQLLTSSYFCMEYITGTALHKVRNLLDKNVQADIDQSLGFLLQQMNQIQGSSFGLFAHTDSPQTTWDAAFMKLLEYVLQDGEDVGVELPLSKTEFMAIATQHSSALKEIQTPALVHWDLWDGNIFIDPKTNKINGIIDFERALWADPLMEVNFGAFGINFDFFRGYGKGYPFSPTEEERRLLYNMYLFLIMVIEPTFRNYPNKDQENWARERLDEQILKLR